MMRNSLCSVLVLTILLIAGVAEAQVELAGSLHSGDTSQRSVLFGEIAVEAVSDHRVVVALDTNAEDGLADLLIAFESGEPIDVAPLRGYGLVRLGATSVTLTLPQLQESLVFTTDSGAEVADALEQDGVRWFLSGRSLTTSIPHQDNLLGLEEALLAETRRAPQDLQSLAAAIFHQDPGGGSTGSCASSCSVTCHDGTSCSVNCPASCAECKCPVAGCVCNDLP